MDEIWLAQKVGPIFLFFDVCKEQSILVADESED